MTQDSKETAEVNRPGLHIWLRAMVEEGKCPGVEWDDRNELSFRIPWRNQKSRHWEESDSKIFMEYARHTGKYKTGGDMDFPRWKQNLKSAINKNRFIQRLRHQDKLNSQRPYRVYQFIRDDSSEGRYERPNTSPTHKTVGLVTTMDGDFACTREALTPTDTSRSDSVSPPGHLPWSLPLNIRSDSCEQQSGNIPELEGLLGDEAAGSPVPQHRILREILENKSQNMIKFVVPEPEVGASARSSDELWHHPPDVEMDSENESDPLPPFSSTAPVTLPANSARMQSNIKHKTPVLTTALTMGQALTLGQGEPTASGRPKYSTLPFPYSENDTGACNSFAGQPVFSTGSSTSQTYERKISTSEYYDKSLNNFVKAEIGVATSHQPCDNGQLGSGYSLMQAHLKPESPALYLPVKEQISSRGCYNSAVADSQSKSTASDNQMYFSPRLGERQMVNPGNHPRSGTELMHMQVLYGTPHYVALSETLTSHQLNRCRLYHGEVSTERIQMELKGSEPAIEREIPPVDEHKVQEKYRKFIKDILWCMEAGIVLSFEDGDIYAERRCRPRVFCSDGVASSKPLPRSSRKRKIKTKIFDYKSFEDALKKHEENTEHPVPRDHVLLTIGEEILPNDDSPTRHVPIYIVIRHVKAASERYRILGASAISSNPMYSDPDSFDRITQLFKDVDLKSREMKS